MSGPSHHGSTPSQGNEDRQSTTAFIKKLIIELVILLIQVTYHWTVAIVKFFLPTSLIGKDIRGQTVLITGSGGGIGSLLAKRFAEKGCNLVLWDVNEELNNATVASVKDMGVKVFSYTVDLSNKDSIYATANKVDNDIGKVDILVNNAGFVTGKKALEAEDRFMKLTMEVNSMAHFWMAKAFVKEMVRRNSGHVVTIASAAGLLGVPGMADYCASKFASIGFEESFRQELDLIEDNNVKTTIVCPFLIKTPMFSGCSAKYPLLLDALEPEYVADKIIDAVLRNQEIIYLPKTIHILSFMKCILPISVQKPINDFAGSTTLMNSFLGRQKSD